MTAHRSSSAVGFPLGDGECARLLQGHDWGVTTLGPIESWSPNLRAVTAMMMSSPVAMTILWGIEGVQFYNDAYAAIAGERHPGLFGKPVRGGWPEVAAFNDHVMTTVLAGQALTYREREMQLYRNGTPERMWIDLDYSPLLGDDDRPAGVLAIVTDRTVRIHAQRQVAAQHERFRTMFEQAPGFIALMEGPEHRFSLVNQAYNRLMRGRTVVGLTVREAVPEAERHGLLDVLDEVYRSGEPFAADEFKFAVLDQQGRLEDHYLDFIYQPIRDSEGMICGIFAQGSDMTERVLAEAALRRSRQEYRKLADALILANNILSSVPRPTGDSDS